MLELPSSFGRASSAAFCFTRSSEAPMLLGAKESPRRSTDRTEACGASNRGSIPLEGVAKLWRVKILSSAQYK